MNRQTKLLRHLNTIYAAAQKSDDGQRCMVAPSPELQKKLKKDLASIRSRATGTLSNFIRLREPTAVGLNDGMIIPPDEFELGTPSRVVRSAAAARAPLNGTVRIIVVLVDFSDKVMTRTQAAFDKLFFSLGQMTTGSVREYYREVTGGRIDIQGHVVGPYRMPRTLAQYANGASGTGGAAPNAQTLARDAAVAANAAVNYAPYDNDGNGYVDAFIVIHAGQGGEVTGSNNDIWSHKWVLSGGAYNADGTKIYAYLTVPEDSKIGVCCHELGHLLFGWPDLYDTDYSSEGLGNWCLMAGGSWNGGGDTPAHPCAWCKAGQQWVTVVNQTTNAIVSIPDVKDAKKVWRLWTKGQIGNEYFLVENRQRKLFDQKLPGDGLLILRVDDSIASNADENHPKVALMQADGLKQLQQGTNRGDPGDPFPGTKNNKAFNSLSNPNSKTYAGTNSGVGVTQISASAPVMKARLTVKPQLILPRKAGSRGKEPAKVLFNEKMLKQRATTIRIGK